MKKIFVLLFMLFLFSCGDESNLSLLESESNKEETVLNGFIIQEYAEYIARNHQSYDDTNVSDTKSVNTKSLKNTIVHMTQDYQPAFYIINYNEGGFVIISADNRLMPVIAEVEHGEFSYEDENFPPALQLWMDEICEYVVEARQNNAEPSDDVKLMWDKTDLVKTKCTTVWASECEYEFEHLYSYIICGPHISGIEWRQGGGYNDMMDGSCSGNEQYLLGCATVATGIAMRYYCKPTFLNWANMPLNSATNTTATFLRDLAMQIVVTPGCSSTSGSLTNMCNALKYYGYSNAAIYDYNPTTLMTQIHNNRVVILYGVTDSGVAHTWVVSGVHYSEQYSCMYDVKRVLTPYATGVTVPPTNFYINWGWGSSYDGWFHIVSGSAANPYQFSNNRKMISNLY